ncbi:hypothetical protein BKA70DRAFT_1510445 [Coprinopsis sp. MPI-PUGE-AT-0042]|nr:hypothetical protein BKA70DRAFT_1510445 [Coprinopsis sp. MPI-PUGE-AT-0042]
MADIETTQPPAENTTETGTEDADEEESREREAFNEEAKRNTKFNPNQEIMLMKQRVEEMEREAKKLRELQAAAEANSGAEDGEGTGEGGDEESGATDNRSVYVGNVDYGATPEEIQAHFQACGVINRVTILCDKFTGHPKGYAYVEFAEPEHVDAAVAMDNSLFRGRLLKALTVEGDGEEEDTEGDSGVDIADTRLIQEAVVADVDEVSKVYVNFGSAGGLLCLTDACLANYFLRGETPHATRGSKNSVVSSTMASRIATRFTRLMSTSATNKAAATPASYPFSKTALTPPPTTPNPVPNESLLKGKGLMDHLRKTLPTPEKQALINKFFSRRSPDQLRPGSIVTVLQDQAPTQFTGVLIAVRRRGQDTSFRLRNVIQRTGVEMQFFANSPSLKEIKVVRTPPGGRMRRAKLFYLRDSPDKMSMLAGGKR